MPAICSVRVVRANDCQVDVFRIIIIISINRKTTDLEISLSFAGPIVQSIYIYEYVLARDRPPVPKPIYEAALELKIPQICRLPMLNR